MLDVQFVVGIHGNELTPAQALTLEGCSYVFGNPKAASQGVRYIERDLNASFGTCGMSYEERRARALLQMIPPTQAVIDFHTFSCDSAPFCVVVDTAQISLAKMLGIQKIVVMKHDIKKGCALISHRSGVSVEVGRHGTNSAFLSTQEVVKSLQRGEPVRPYQLYEVYDVINEPGAYTNFEEHEDGFYPVLAGEVAYDHFGLKARKMLDL